MNAVNCFQNYQIRLTQGNDNTVPLFLHLINMMSYLVHFLIFLALQESTNISSRTKFSSSFIFQTDQVCLPLWAHSLEIEKGLASSCPSPPSYYLNSWKYIKIENKALIRSDQTYLSTLSAKRKKGLLSEISIATPAFYLLYTFKNIYIYLPFNLFISLCLRYFP